MAQIEAIPLLPRTPPVGPQKSAEDLQPSLVVQKLKKTAIPIAIATIFTSGGIVASILFLPGALPAGLTALAVVSIIAGSSTGSALITGVPAFMFVKYSWKNLQNIKKIALQKASEDAQEEKSAVRIQALGRGYTAKTDYKQKRAAALRVQTNFRGHTARTSYKRMRDATILIQTNFRGHKARSSLALSLSQELGETTEALTQAKEKSEQTTKDLTDAQKALKQAEKKSGNAQEELIKAQKESKQAKEALTPTRRVFKKMQRRDIAITPKQKARANAKNTWFINADRAVPIARENVTQAKQALEQAKQAKKEAETANNLAEEKLETAKAAQNKDKARSKTYASIKERLTQSAGDKATIQKAKTAAAVIIQTLGRKHIARQKKAIIAAKTEALESLKLTALQTEYQDKIKKAKEQTVRLHPLLETATTLVNKIPIAEPKRIALQSIDWLKKPMQNIIDKTDTLEHAYDLSGWLWFYLTAMKNAPRIIRFLIKGFDKTVKDAAKISRDYAIYKAVLEQIADVTESINEAETVKDVEAIQKENANFIKSTQEKVDEELSIRFERGMIVLKMDNNNPKKKTTEKEQSIMYYENFGKEKLADIRKDLEDLALGKTKKPDLTHTITQDQIDDIKAKQPWAQK